jgi:hypothetical protein
MQRCGFGWAITEIVRNSPHGLELEGNIILRNFKNESPSGVGLYPRRLKSSAHYLHIGSCFYR